MQIDELRGELTGLADAMEPFTGDVRAVHRHERRRRAVFSAIAIAVVAIVGVSAIAVVRHGDNRVRVTAGPDKEVQPKEMTHVDAIVVPAAPAVKAALDASPLVTKYARIPQGDRSSDPLLVRPNNGLCALQNQQGFAVDVTSPAADVRGLALALVGHATVYDVSSKYGADVEFFMKVAASAHQVESVQAALAADADVLSVRHLSKADAYAIFKKDFAAQPALIESTKPSDLPESFRIIVKAGHSVPAVTQRYSKADGVADAIVGTPQYLFDPSLLPKTHHKLVSPCNP